MTLELFKFKGFSPNHLEVKCLYLDTSSFYHPDPIQPSLFVLPEVDTSWPHSWPSRQTSPISWTIVTGFYVQKDDGSMGSIRKIWCLAMGASKTWQNWLSLIQRNTFDMQVLSKPCPRIQATFQMSTHVYSKLRESTTDWPSLGWDANIIVKFG